MISYTDWYVIQVSTGSEHTVRNMVVKELDRTGVGYEDCFVPLIEYARSVDGKYETKVKPMFPGYIFLITECIEEVNSVLKTIMTFTKILGEGSMFLPLYKSEVDFLLSFSENNYNMTMSYGVIENDEIIVHDGPMTGKEGLIKRINRHKRTAELEIDFMGRRTRIIVPLEIISKK